MSETDNRRKNFVSSAFYATGVGAVPPFTLEHAYRERFAPGMVDLSSSSPQPLTAREVLDDAGAGYACLLDDALDYEPGGGSQALRGAVASLYDDISADHVLITAGAAEAIRVAAEAAIRPGDCVVVQRPAYQALRAAPLAGGAHVLDWTPAPGFQFDFAELPAEAAHASVVLFNNPHGPSGSLARASYTGPARLIADEVYRPAALIADQRVPSVIDMGEGAVAIGDLSKPLGLGGLRIGWIVSRDRAFIRECAEVLDYFSGSVSALSAHVALAAINRFDAHLERQLAQARGNLRILTTFIEQHVGWLDWCPPQAGYTAFPRLKADISAEALSERMRARGVFVLDGAAFESPDYVRIGFGQASVPFAKALCALGEELCAAAPAAAPTPPAGDVILLAKEPSPGRAKTRLAANVGAERAAELCEGFVHDSVEVACAGARRLYIAASPSEALGFFRSLAPGARCFVQPDADFGSRLLHAFETALGDGAQRPVLIGSDSPTLPSHLLSAAHRALRTHDVVLGPADDGGYYLIGMNTPYASLFQGIDWSTERVLAQTLERARVARLSVFLLPPWYDVDNGRDLERLACDPLLREHTRRALQRGRLEEVVA
jgi:rSAM/selenodomain-associated transferase 1